MPHGRDIDLASPPRRARTSRREAEAAVRHMIAYAGEDPARAALAGAPQRLVRAWDEFFAGYALDPAELLERTFEETDGFDGIVLMRDIRLESHSAADILPFVGRAHVAYLPTGRVVGLSKLARVVDAYARRMQSQEALTVRIARTLERALRPRGVAVMIEAEHLGVTTRGVHRHGAGLLTQCLLGAFREDPEARRELLALLGRG